MGSSLGGGGSGFGQLPCRGLDWTSLRAPRTCCEGLLQSQSEWGSSGRQGRPESPKETNVGGRRRQEMRHGQGCVR